ncbi:hypothetical protein HDK64DRAFT_32313 [Phyllosticta capitalensis]
MSFPTQQRTRPTKRAVLKIAQDLMLIHESDPENRATARNAASKTRLLASSRIPPAGESRSHLGPSHRTNHASCRSPLLLSLQVCSCCMQICHALFTHASRKISISPCPNSPPATRDTRICSCCPKLLLPFPLSCPNPIGLDHTVQKRQRA